MGSSNITIEKPHKSEVSREVPGILDLLSWTCAASGKPFKVALTAAMHKLLTILNAMVKANQKWKENLCPRNA